MKSMSLVLYTKQRRKQTHKNVNTC